MTSWLKDWAEYSKPLGAPTGAATKVVTGAGNETTLYTRAFATGTRVEVNLTATDADAHARAAAERRGDAWRLTPGAPDERLGGQITTTCIYWSDGSMTGNGCPF